MNIIQVITCWVGNSPETHQFKRHSLWLNYMDNLKGNLNFNDIYFIDNASNFETLKLLGGEILDTNFNQLVPATTRPHLHIIHFTEHLSRVSLWDYPYVFRAFKFTPKIIEKVNPDKILIIDTDFYPVSQKMVDILNNTQSGFLAARDKRYGFLEAAFSVLCKDTFQKYIDFCNLTNFDTLKLKGTVEMFMPFTGAIPEIVGGRYGELRQPQTKDMDYYGQTYGQEIFFDLK